MAYITCMYDHIIVTETA